MFSALCTKVALHRARHLREEEIDEVIEASWILFKTAQTKAEQFLEHLST